MNNRRNALGVFAAVATAAATACGARTTLTEPEELVATDASALDARRDVVREADSSRVPPLDASTRDVFVPNECADAGTTLVYLISADSELYSFYPPTRAIRKVGDIRCPGASSTPASMAVDRQGTAYSVFLDGSLWKLSTTTAACAFAGYPPGQGGLVHFGMGFVANGPEDELYISDTSSSVKGLGRIDLATMKLSWVGEYDPPLPRCELSGTSDGRLFAFCLEPNGGSTLNELDRASAHVTGSDRLAVGRADIAFAFAAWGGEFWIFTGETSTTITEYDPRTKSEKTVGSSSAIIVGAGVSPCGTR